jgi:nicotinate-nucleotide adenylyltransferase
MKIALFFGSFNPIHIGHLAIANYFVEYTDIDKLWFVVSPQNPFKEKKSLLAEHHRLALVKEAIEYDNRFKASDIEFALPKPSYTIDTLTYLKEKYPENEYILIMGADNIVNFKKWKNSELILKDYKIYVYPRPNIDTSMFENNDSIKITDAPIIEISSSFIRNSIKEKKDIRYFLHPKVFKYIDEMNFYIK